MIRRSVLLLGLLVGVARAQPAPEPWQVGVSDADKATAQTQLELGNNLFTENRYDEALAAYRAGLAAWKHPSIQFNIAATLIALGRHVEALDELEQAMRFGPKPLKDQWREALSYKMLLDEKVGSLSVRCNAAIELTLDTNTPIKCGQATLRVRSGEHVLLAQQAGFITQRKKLVVPGGKLTSETITLVALKDAAVTRTRWAVWKPWVVVGASALVAGGGLLLDLQAQGLYSDYARALVASCGDLACRDDQLPSTLDRARLRERAGIGLMVAGGLGVATGVALVLLNRPFTEIPNERRLAIAPAASADSLGFVIAGRWR